MELVVSEPVRLQGESSALLLSITPAQGKHLWSECYLDHGGERYIEAQYLDNIITALRRWLCPPEWLRQGANIRYCSGGVLSLADPHHCGYASVESGQPVLRIQDAMSLEWVGKTTLTEEHVVRWLHQMEELRQWHIAVQGWDPLVRQ